LALPQIGFVFSNRFHSTRFGFRNSNFGFPAEGRLWFCFFKTPRAGLGANRNWVCLALNWLCFFAAQNHENLHISLSYNTLSRFNPPANWLCFFNLSSIFRRFLLFFTCFLHYFGIIFSKRLLFRRDLHDKNGFLCL